MAERVIHLLVEVEVDGRLCGENCRLFVPVDDRGNDPYCAGFGSIKRLVTKERYRRNPDCLASESSRREPGKGE